MVDWSQHIFFPTFCLYYQINLPSPNLLGHSFPFEIDPSMLNSILTKWLFGKKFVTLKKAVIQFNSSVRTFVDDVNIFYGSVHLNPHELVCSFKNLFCYDYTHCNSINPAEEITAPEIHTGVYSGSCRINRVSGVCIWNGNKARAVHLAMKEKQSWFEFTFSCKKSVRIWFSLKCTVVYSQKERGVKHSRPYHAVPAPSGTQFLHQDGIGMPLWWCWWQRRLLLFCVGENVCRNKLHQIFLNSYWNILSGLHLFLITNPSSVSVFLFFIVSECVSDSMSVSLSLHVHVCMYLFVLSLSVQLMVSLSNDPFFFFFTFSLLD